MIFLEEGEVGLRCGLMYDSGNCQDVVCSGNYVSVEVIATLIAAFNVRNI